MERMLAFILFIMFKVIVFSRPALSEGPAPEGRAPEGPAPEGRAPEGPAPEGRAPEGPAPEGRAPEERAPEGPAPDGMAPEGPAPEGEAPEGRAPEGPAPEGRAPEGPAPEGRAPEGGPPGDEPPTNEAKTLKPMPRIVPNWGYEPYWHNGNWAYKSTLASTLEGSPLITYKVCGDPCSYMLQKLGPVCVRRQHKNVVKNWCQSLVTSVDFFSQCSNTYPDVYDDNFYTAPNYCSFLHDQCLDKHGQKSMLLHLGKCNDPHNAVVYKPIESGQQLISRKDYYLDALQKRLDSIPSTTSGFDKDYFLN